LLSISLVEHRRASARALQAWVDALYGANKPQGVADDLIAERRREAAGE
jgi:hypothetical protein